MPGNFIPQPPSGEITHNHETLFPLAPEWVMDGLANLRSSSNEMLGLLTDARGRFGAADDLYANLPFDTLVDWHVDSGDFEPEGSLLYRAGLLYGTGLALEVARLSDISEPLSLTNADIFQAAVDYLRDTYRGLDDSAENNWRRQKERELLYTGSDILSLANATLQDVVLNRLRALGMPAEPNVLAQHIGVVDGVIFVDAYRSLLKGAMPHRFDKQVVEYAPRYNSKIHERGSNIDGAALFELESIDDLSAVVSGLDELREMKREGVSPAGAVYRGRSQFLQIGPNAFTTAVEVTSIEAPRYSLKRIGVIGLLGVGVDTWYMIYRSGLPLVEVPVATIFNLGVGLAIERGGRRMLKREAAERGLDFTIAGQDKPESKADS